MADSETETNPRKKIKIDHDPDPNGGLSKGSEVQAASSEVTQDKEGDAESKVKTDTPEEEEEVNRKDEVHTESEDSSSKVGNNQSDRTLNIEDNDDDDDDDDDYDNSMDVDASGRGVDVSDADSDVSALSDASSLSGEDTWKASAAGPMAWVMRCMEDGVDPRSILTQVIPDEKDIPDVDDYTLWKLVVNLVSEPPPRDKLPDINTLEDVLQLLQKCKKIMVLTGAGVSVSCGIPDFRSRNGIYARLAVDFPDLPDPQAMFDIRYFKRDQRPFFKFAKEIYPGQFEPSKSHKFIKLIEDHGKLLRNYTQNIDTLEQVAGIKNVIQCHGSFATATCMTCHHKCSSDDIKLQIMEQVIPLCPQCEPQTSLSVMKPDIVFFGESLPEEFHHQMSVDKDDCDLLIVIGSSLKVRPVALIPNSLPAHVPQILINKEHLRSLNFDVELLGDCDQVISEICRRLGGDWTKIANKETMTQIGIGELTTPTCSTYRQEKSSTGNEKKVLEEKDCKVDEKQTEISETSGKKSTAVTSNTEQESDTNCQCDDVSKGDKDMKEEANETHEGKSTEKTEKGEITGDTVSSESKSKTATKNEMEIDTGTVTENKSENSGKTPGQEKNTSTETEAVSKEIENGKVNDDVKPGSSKEGSEKPGSSSDLQQLRKMWRPGRQNVALRLETNQFCYIPPRKYIFPEAEYYTVLRSNSESDRTSDRDTTMDSSRELDQTNTNTDSSAIEGELVDLTSDDEDEKVRPKPGSQDNDKVDPKPDNVSNEKVEPKLDDVDNGKVELKPENCETDPNSTGTKADNDKEKKTDDVKEDYSKGAGDNERQIVDGKDKTADVVID